MSGALEFLSRSQNADGGWGYRPNGMSFVEPTGAAILALASDPASLARVRARDFLFSLQQADGGWGVGAVDEESGWMTAWAVWACTSLAPGSSAVRRGVDWLLTNAGLQVTEPATRARLYDLYRLNSSLVGWSWQPGDAAWVHPTALAVISLVAAGQASATRTRQGVEFLFDRAVSTGGWNIGNPEMIGKTIPATVQDSAVALIALHAAGVNAGDGKVSRGLEFLQERAESTGTAAELAWSLYALDSYLMDASIARQRLKSLQLPDGSWQGNPFITAIALLVLKDRA